MVHYHAVRMGAYAKPMSVNHPGFLSSDMNWHRKNPIAYHPSRFNFAPSDAQRALLGMSFNLYVSSGYTSHERAAAEIAHDEKDYRQMAELVRSYPTSDSPRGRHLARATFGLQATEAWDIARSYP